MTDMIDKIARAMHASVNGHVIPPPTWDNQSEQSQNYWRIGARAAIAAMREPTEEQYEALSATGKMWRELDSKTVWQTYIDAALEDE